MTSEAIEIFFSYSDQDEELRDELEKHLAMLKQSGVITGWHHQNIEAGREREHEIDTHLNQARLILLLVSPDFIASDCYDIEVKRAMERHEAGEARVIPVILRPVDWHEAPFSRLQALPTNAKPVTTWENQDEAFKNVAQGIRKVIKTLTEAENRQQQQSPTGTSSKIKPSEYINPFEFGSPVSPHRFYGRRKEILDVKNRIGAISPQCINIVGLRRNGKTSLLRYIKERSEEFFQPEQKPLIVPFDLSNSKFHTPEGIIEGIRRGIKKLTGEEPWSRKYNEDPFEVEDGLQLVCDRGYRLIVMLDEFEAISRRLEKFQDWGEDWRSKASEGLLTMVIFSKRPLSEIYQPLSLASPFGNIFSSTILGALEEDAWQSLVKNGLSNNVGAQATLSWIDDLAGGLPYYVQMAGAMLWQHGDREQARKEFIFQATPRFQELWDDLTEIERHALRHAAGVSSLATPNSAIIDTLQRHGLLRSDGSLFSSAFAKFIQDQR